MVFFRSRGSRILLAGGALAALAGIAGAIAFYLAFVRDLPDLRDVRDYDPDLASHVFDRNGELIGEFFTERRQLTPLAAIPEHAVRAFIASEDSSFFEHSGIDYVSILRAAWVNLRAGGATRQGASTITQQMVKGLLLTPEQTFERKIREMILARRIESHFTKQEILYLYLNQIYFGHGAYGIGEAARTYFGKPVGDIDVSEAALLAGLPKAPSRYSPYVRPEVAEKRRVYVLGRMLEEGFIDAGTHAAALTERPVLAEPRDFADAGASGYFVEEVRRHLFEVLGGDLVLRGGLVIETTLDRALQAAAMTAVQTGLRDLDRRQGYRGPLRKVAAANVTGEIAALAKKNGLDAAPPAGGPPALQPDALYEGVVTALDKDAQIASVSFAPGVDGAVLIRDVRWARAANPDKAPYRIREIATVFSVGDVAAFRLQTQADDEGEVAVPAGKVRVNLVQEPIVQGALFSYEVDSGEVLAMAGGYDFAGSQFNRVTQAKRQPGSAFKPLIYSAALMRGYTPASILFDRPIVYTDTDSGFVWRPRNYKGTFYGPITMREALARSVNNATVHLFRDVGVDVVIDYVRRLGIESPLNRDLSLALGSSDVSLFELTRAYAVFPAGGRRSTPIFIRRVLDKHGNVLLENVALGVPPGGGGALASVASAPPGETAAPPAAAAEAATTADAGSAVDSVDEQGFPLDPDLAITPELAYLTTSLLKAVVEDPDGTGWRLRDLHRPVAGKTGTTNDQADAWFMGFSPDVVTGVWVGHDETRFLGYGETGSRAAAPIWVDFMRAALRDRRVSDFPIPEPIIFARVDRTTGLLADADAKGVVFQAFLRGTAPTERAETARSNAEGRRLLRMDDF